MFEKSLNIGYVLKASNAIETECIEKDKKTENKVCIYAVSGSANVEPRERGPKQ